MRGQISLCQSARNLKPCAAGAGHLQKTETQPAVGTQLRRGNTHGELPDQVNLIADKHLTQPGVLFKAAVKIRTLDNAEA